MVTITSTLVQKFFYKNIIILSVISHLVVTDNDTQFAHMGFQDLLKGLYIKHHFSLVEYPKLMAKLKRPRRLFSVC